MNKPVHSIVVEDLNLSETLRLAAIKAGETDLTAVFYDVKKMYTGTKNIAHDLYISALYKLKETGSLSDFISSLNTINNEDIIISIDEVLTIRINRLINLYTGIDISVESFIADYDELADYIKNTIDNKLLLENAIIAFTNSLLLIVDSIETNECPVEMIMNWEYGRGTKVTDIDIETINVISENTTTTVTETTLTVNEKPIPEYSCVLMPLPKATIYISMPSTYNQFAGLLKDLTFPKIITKETYPEIHSMLETYRASNSVFKANQWALLVLDKVYVPNKYWEVYYNVDESYRFVLPYQN